MCMCCQCFIKVAPTWQTLKHGHIHNNGIRLNTTLLVFPYELHQFAHWNIHIPKCPKPNHLVYLSKALNQITEALNQITWLKLQFLKFILWRQNTESHMMPQNESLNVHHKTCMVFWVRHCNYILGKMPKMWKFTKNVIWFRTLG